METEAEWIPLRDLRNGAIFETMGGTRAVKSEYHYDNGRGGCLCILLASGEFAHFAQHIRNPNEQARAHDATLVREVVLP